MSLSIDYFYIIYPAIAGGNHLCNLLSLNENFYQRFPSTSYTQDMLKSYDERQNIKYSPEKFDDIKKYTKVQLTQTLKFEEWSSLMYNAHHWEESMDNSVLDFDNPILHTTTEINGEVFTNINMWYNNIMCKASHKANLTDKKTYLLMSHGIARGANIIPQTSDTFVKDFWYNLKNRRKTYAIFMTVPKVKGRAYDRLHQGNPKALNLIREQNYTIPLRSQLNGVITELFNENNSFYLNTDRFLDDDGCTYLQELLHKHLKIILPAESYTLHKLWINMIDNGLNEVKKLNLIENK